MLPYEEPLSLPFPALLRESSIRDSTCKNTENCSPSKWQSRRKRQRFSLKFWDPAAWAGRGASLPFLRLQRVLLPPERCIHLPTKPVGSARISVTGIIKIPKANLKTNNLPSSPLPKTTIQFQPYLTKATFLIFCISISYRTEDSMLFCLQKNRILVFNSSFLS